MFTRLLINRVNYVFFVFFLFLCCKNEGKEVESTFVKKKNIEFEAVLSHYGNSKNDSLKLQAAEFLISNIYGHYSFDKKIISEYYKEIEPILAQKIYYTKKKSPIKNVNLKYQDRLKIVKDIDVITAEYLIKNIDFAFDVWQNEPWSRHIDFSDFCEYLLPYKCIEPQILDNWKDSLYSKYRPLLDELYIADNYKNSVFRACLVIHQYLKKQLSPNVVYDNTEIPFIGESNIDKIPYGTCESYAVSMLAIMRSLGIPGAIDFTPQWPNQTMGHSWNVLFNSDGNLIPFGGICDTEPGEAHRPYDRMAKVYRRMYSVNKDLLKYINETSSAPSVFKDIFIKDVTTEYMKTIDLEVPIVKRNKEEKYVYLAVFDNQNWVPIALGFVEKEKAYFNYMGKNIVYLPVYYMNDQNYSFNYPFLLNAQGDIHYFEPDTFKRKRAVLSRKYKVSAHLIDIEKTSIGGRIEASNYKDFSIKDSIYTINRSHGYGFVELNTKRAYRYWRYVSAPDNYCNIAELAFYEQGSISPVNGDTIGTVNQYRNPHCDKSKVFDGDPVSYFASSYASNAWVGLDLGKAMNIDRMTYLSRSDDNDIRIGDIYELFYYNTEGWVSLGKQTAESAFLIYENVPDNALLLLKDLSRGKEERIFTYENGRQTWW